MVNMELTAISSLPSPIRFFLGQVFSSSSMMKPTPYVRTRENPATDKSGQVLALYVERTTTSLEIVVL